MAAVADRAGSSIGALYTRVPDKTTLVRAVHLRLLNRHLTAFEGLARAESAGDLPLDQLVEHLVTGIATPIRANAGLVRAIIVQGVRDPVMRERVSLGLDDATRTLADVLRRRSHEHAHPDPDLAADMIVRTLTGVLQQVVLLERPFDDRRAAELRTLLLRYLGTHPGAGRG